MKTKIIESIQMRVVCVLSRNQLTSRTARGEYSHYTSGIQRSELCHQFIELLKSSELYIANSKNTELKTKLRTYKDEIRKLRDKVKCQKEDIEIALDQLVVSSQSIFQ